MFDTLYKSTYRTRKFRNIFPPEDFDEADVEKYSNFRWWFHNCELPIDIKSTPDTPATDELKIIYILLLSRYGESHIASENEPQFRLEVMRTIFQYGPLWAKELDIQKQLRGLNLEDITQGSVIKTGHSYNPSTTVSIDSIGNENAPINDLNMTKYEKSKLDGYNELLLLLNKDVTEEFLNRFQKLFTKFPVDVPILFWNCEEDEGEDDEE